jgi:DNA-binding IclR family transcriptional regulator
MPASTIHRLLRTLEAEDFITQNPSNGKYRLGAAAFIMGSNVADMNRLVEISLPYIAKLSSKYNASAHVAIEQNSRILCLEKISPFFDTVKTPPRGAGHELHLTSVGKSILAFTPEKRQQHLIDSIKFQPVTPNSIRSKNDLMEELKKVQRKGYATDKCESSPHLYCFGAPILSDDNIAIAAISISLNSICYPDSSASIIKDVKNSATEISVIINRDL